MKIEEILNITNGSLIVGNQESQCNNFFKDTREKEIGDTYIGIKGEKFDGSKLWREALDRGASTVIVENIEFEKQNVKDLQGKNIIKVPNTLLALSEIAKYKRKQYLKNLKVIGITGSVGKTSTKDIIYSVLKQRYKTFKTYGNNNNLIGLPFQILNLKDQEIAILEMGMNHVGEIKKLSQIAQPDISVITNIGTSHIGNLGSRENILSAKLEILDGMHKKILVINNDNDLLHDYYKKNRDVKIYTCGIHNDSEIMARNIEIKDDFSQFTYCSQNGKQIKVKVPVAGIHFIYNALCAVTIGKYFGLNDEEIVKGIEEFELTKKRMDIVKLKNDVIIINDSYNASLESMQVSLQYLGGLKNRRKIAVLGDMLELGDYSKELHEKVGKEVIKNNINILVCCGEDSKYIIKSAKEGMEQNNIYYFDTNDEVEKFIKQISKTGDAILFKASNGMKFFEIVDNLLKEC